MPGRVLKAPWHEDYLKFTVGQESPEAFHRWAALSVLASTLGRNVWLDFGYYQVYPNLYVVLIAESAKARKTAALRIEEDVLKAIDNAPSVLSQKITTEAIIRRLMATGMQQDDAGDPKNSECVILSEELSVFIGADAFQNGTAALLTAFFDCKDTWEYETVSRNIEHLHHICVNLLGASTPDWLRRCIPHDAVGGGFVGRFILVNEKKGKLIPRPKLTPKLIRLKDQLIHDLSYIRQMKGEFSLSDDAGKYFDKWYYDWMNKHADEIPGYGPKKHTYVWKLSMILSASAGDSMTVTVEDIKAAISILDGIELNMKQVVESIWVSPIGLGCEKVLDIIRRCKKEGIERTWLAKKTWRFADKDTLDKILETLHSSGLIKPEVIPGSGKRDTRRYTALTQKEGD